MTAVLIFDTTILTSEFTAQYCISRHVCSRGPRFSMENLEQTGLAYKSDLRHICKSEEQSRRKALYPMQSSFQTADKKTINDVFAQC